MAKRRGLGAVIERFGRGAQNAMELVRLGRLADPYGASYDIKNEGDHYRLRRYRGQNLSRALDRPLLLVPPLMITAEIYDISEDTSAVQSLLQNGVDVWICDFGAPEREDGGLERTLDDHIRAVSDAIDEVHRQTGQDVHLGGYSQGGMFCYQVAAYRASKHVASVVTFGSPVDIHRNLPNVGDTVAAEIARLLTVMVAKPLSELDALPAFLTATGFKVVSLRKEVSQIVDFFSKLHDRQALERREGRRRFLGGEGFVAWPGPALRSFVEEFILHNRMLSGGFVIGGKAVSLADISCPVLFFVGERDDMARPASVRAVRDVVGGESFEILLPTGHFGLVVGSKAMKATWPSVADWIRWREDKGSKPRVLRDEADIDVEDVAFADMDFDVRLFVDAARDITQTAWNAVGSLIEDAGSYAKNVRWQLPRLEELEALDDSSAVGFGRALAEKAKDTPDATFFLWKGRAFTYADANTRVEAVVRGLWHSGVRPGDRLGIWMHSRPSYLTLVAALSRLGAVPVLLPADAPPGELRSASNVAKFYRIVADPEHAVDASELAAEVWVLGGGPERPVASGALDLEAVDPAGVQLPASFVPNPGVGRDLAMVFLAGRGGTGLRAVPITGRRWAASAIGVAAACTLTPDDTVFVGLPLHHMSGLLVAVGGALVGGARLALADARGTEGRSSFLDEKTLVSTAADFWSEIRRYGATVVFYAGESARPLVLAPRSSRDRNNPIRLFAGAGMRNSVWAKLESRFRVAVVEFYASSEVPAVLANTSGKRGFVGSPLPGSSKVELVRFHASASVHAKAEVRDELIRENGWLVRVEDGQFGIMLAAVDPSTDSPRVIRDAFRKGDAFWYTGDVFARDHDGDYRFMGRLGDMVQSPDGSLHSVRAIEDTLEELEDVLLCVARRRAGGIHVRIALSEGASLEVKGVRAALAELPEVLRRVELTFVPLRAVQLSDGFRPFS